MSNGGTSWSTVVKIDMEWFYAQKERLNFKMIQCSEFIGVSRRALYLFLKEGFPLNRIAQLYVFLEHEEREYESRIKQGL